jgi:hypothetical protein
MRICLLLVLKGVEKTPGTINLRIKSYEVCHILFLFRQRCEVNTGIINAPSKRAELGSGMADAL